MDIRDHLNLINNHGYDGYIAIYRGPGTLAIKSGAVVLVQPGRIPEYGDAPTSEIEWCKNHVTIERPMSQKEIDDQRSRGSGLKTMSPCVGVPIRLLERIQL
jgi:hypothetical protein